MGATSIASVTKTREVFTMFGEIVALVIGVAGGAIGMFFVAKNNEEKFTAALGIDFERMVNDLLDKTEVDEKVKKFIDDVKAKLKK